MKLLLKILACMAMSLFISFMVSDGVSASEGTIEIQSTGKYKLECFASSVFLRNKDYDILVTCKDVTYPPSDERNVYLLWATPKAGGNPIRLGPLQYGKVEYTTRVAFSELYVTLEVNDRPRTPTGEVVARGTVQPIKFVEGEITPTPTEPATSFGEIIEQQLPTPTQAPKTGGLFATLRRGGIILAIGVFVVLIILAALTRSRG